MVEGQRLGNRRHRTIGTRQRGQTNDHRSRVRPYFDLRADTVEGVGPEPIHEHHLVHRRPSLPIETGCWRRRAGSTRPTYTGRADEAGRCVTLVHPAIIGARNDAVVMVMV